MNVVVLFLSKSSVCVIENIDIIIERSNDMFSAYAENVEGVYGGGDTIEEAQQSIRDSIRLLKEHNNAGTIPAILQKTHQLLFKFDI